MDDPKRPVAEPSAAESRQCDLNAEWLNNPHEVRVADDVLRQARERHGLIAAQSH